MSRGKEPDEMALLAHASSIAKSPTRLDTSENGYEMVDIETGDIGTQRHTSVSSNPPAYSATWEHELDNGKDSPTFNGYSGKLQNRSSKFGSRTKPAVRSGFHRFLRFLLRSGSYASHISYERALSDQSNTPRKFSGWRGGVLAATISAGTVLLINLIFTMWAAAKSGSGTDVGTIYEGKCSTVSHTDSWLHIAINVMGTLLLGASNFTMQCLSSPTRAEVDIAHSKGRYKDIGLPSLKNLNGGRKKILFSLLVLSTLPLHFLWNSAVFTTTQNLDYNVYVVTPDFLAREDVNCSQNATRTFYSYSNSVSPTRLDLSDYIMTSLAWNVSNNTAAYDFRGTSDAYWYQYDVCNISKALLSSAKVNNLTRLSNKDCIKAYGPGNSLVKEWANVLAVTKEQPSQTNDTILMQFRYETYVSNWTGNNWVCDPEHLLANKYKCRWQDIAANASEWTLGPVQASPQSKFDMQPTEEWPIDYCLAQKTDLAGHCLLQYSLVIMIFVIIANLVKFSCILFILCTHLEPVLATIGDGIATFLERQDETTKGRPFLTRKQARNFARQGPRGPRRWTPPKRPLRWWHAPSGPRWSITLILCLIAIITVAFLLERGNENLNDTDRSPYSLGFGTYNEDAILSMFEGENLTASSFTSNSLLMSMVAVANLPQVIVSCLYFAYNTVYTSMVSADEFSRFSSHRKALRTTDPKGHQRSTYWLSLPWTYALPLAICSSVLHWLISQSLFVARTEILDTYGEPEQISYMQVGYSPIAILLALLFGTGMVIGMILNGTRKLKGGVLVGNNSLAIASACQREEKDEGAQLKRVRWGAVRHMVTAPNAQKDKMDIIPGHCCFSSEEVDEPRVGEMYI